ncbi:phage gp6-like head-tail connector protein [Butyrivibrio sp. CB08]|uniref:head-tail connector protein n=1 Tax=Butyrivibrio sp. CB08 TaxID=2364879 RepID=UPI000EA8ABF7|nr:head-tail connector protein [Butyrivibrio sp. CB08]RKM55417.1 phage gp6-like head-tail connector protein [Butyrivibrio sp. CB08]
MLVSVEEAKKYLRVDYDEEDQLIESLIKGAMEIVSAVSRLDVEAVNESENEAIRTAVLYSTAYLYEHREEADHHELTLSLRALLSGNRKVDF